MPNRGAAGHHSVVDAVVGLEQEMKLGDAQVRVIAFISAWRIDRPSELTIK
jgi:hypothetical protein